MAIQIRRGTDSEWESNKSNIVAGEPAVTLDSERMFVGTGSGTYMELANLDVLADAFDSSASYEVGDFVAYHGKVYKCNTDHSGAWNASDFDEVALADALDSLGEDVYTKAEADALLALKANASDVNSALALKADKSDTYTKTEVNTALALKADKSDTYTKAQVDTALGLKSDKADTYTKEQVDAIAEQIIRESEYSNFEMKSVSGDFVHITDGAGLIPVKDLKIGIDAVQDLHGYDAPWVGGAGVNKFGGYTILNAYLPASGSIVAESNNRTAVLPCLPSTQYTFKIVRTAITGSDDMQVSEFSGDTEPTYGSSGTRVDAVGYNSTTNIAQLTFTTSANTKWLAVKYANINQTNADKTIETTQLELGSSAGDFTPYANICPISGWTGAKVNVNGVNQWDEEWEVGGIANVTGVSFNTNDRIRSKNFNPCLPNTTYYDKLPVSYANIFFYDNSKTFISQTPVNGGVTFTTPQNCAYFRFSVQPDYGATYNHDISINYPSTDTDYHAYDGHVYSVTWQTEAGTVYGGTLDVTTGELVVTWAKADLWTLNWYLHSTYASVFFAEIIGKKFNNADMICSQYENGGIFANYANLENGKVYASSSLIIARIAIKDISYSTTEQFISALENSNAQLVYELATPVTYIIDPTEVLTLLGENNIFADTGAVEELIYRISRQ